MLIGYIDPSVMTYAIQIGAGVVIALGAFIGIKFRKAKKKVSKKLGIDENRNKEVESDDIDMIIYTKDEVIYTYDNRKENIIKRR